MKTTRSLVILIVVSLSATALAQPAPGGGSAAPTPTPSDANDQQLYPCKKQNGMVSVTFKPETELKDLIAWAMSFTCKNFMLDPRIVSTGKKVTVIAPNK